MCTAGTAAPRSWWRSAAKSVDVVRRAVVGAFRQDAVILINSKHGVYTGDRHRLLPDDLLRVVTSRPGSAIPPAVLLHQRQFHGARSMC